MFRYRDKSLDETSRDAYDGYFFTRIIDLLLYGRASRAMMGQQDQEI